MVKSIKICVCAISILACSFANTVPSSFWPQKDRTPQEIGAVGSAQRVLIASRTSAFKDSVVNAVIDSLRSDSVYIRVIGIKEVVNEDPEKWTAMLIVNTCMAWQGDNKVQNFLKRHPSYPSFIMLTTSGDSVACGSSKWIPQNVDAVSSASSISHKSAVVENLIGAIRKRFAQISGNE